MLTHFPKVIASVHFHNHEIVVNSCSEKSWDRPYLYPWRQVLGQNKAAEGLQHQRNESFTSYGHRSNHCLQSDGLHHHTSVIFAFTREDHPLTMAVLCARNGENTIYWDWIYFLQHTTWVITVQQTGTNAIHEFLPEISLRPYSVRHTILIYLLDLLQKLGSFKLSAIRHNETTEISLRRHATHTPTPFYSFFLYRTWLCWTHGLRLSSAFYAAIISLTQEIILWCGRYIGNINSSIQLTPSTFWPV